MENTRLAATVLLAFEDDETGVGKGLVECLYGASSSCLERLATPLCLPLKSYGIPDVDVHGDLVNFVDPEGSPKVSLILIKAPPSVTNVYAAHLILEFIIDKAPIHSSRFALIIASTAMIPIALLDKDINDRCLRVAFLNGASDRQWDSLCRLPSIPSTMRVGNSFLASILHFVHVFNITSILLIVPISRLSHRKTQSEMDENLKIIQLLEDHLAKQLGLSLPVHDINGEFEAGFPRKFAENEEWRRFYL